MVHPASIEKLKIAFLGGAINSAVGSAHYSAIRLVNQFELVAGCFSLDKEFNQRTAEQYHVGLNRIYNNIDELIEKEKNNLNAIVVLTPTDQHAEHVIKFIRNNIPVICEKALACTISEAENIKRELEKNKGYLSVIYNYLGYPVFRELRYLILNGNLGKIHHIQIEMPQEGFDRVDTDGNPIVPQTWRLHDGIIPTISLDLGVHLHIMIKYLTGEKPLGVTALSKSFGNFQTVKDDISCIIEYSNDIVCNMWYSKIAIGNRNGLKLRIYGEQGSAEWLQEDPEHLKLADNRGKRWTLDRGSNDAKVCNQPRYSRFKAGHPAGFIEAFANYYTDIAGSLQSYNQNKTAYLNDDCFGITEALEGLHLLDTITRASSSKTWEEI